MRGYKNISWIAAIIYFVSFGMVSFTRLDNSIIKNDKFLNNQLQLVSQRSEINSIVIYGSSGVLVGLSAKAFTQKTGYQSMNLSTAGQGGQIDKFIEIVSRSENGGKVLLLSDRGYRSPKIHIDTLSEIVATIKKYSLIVNIRDIISPTNNRDQFGDVTKYQIRLFEVPQSLVKPRYSILNLNLMKAHVDEALQGGLCPILAYVPLLVPDESVAAHLAATEELSTAVREAGIEQYVAFTPMIETDKNLFIDIQHMSEKGREKWTRLLIEEITSRQMCGVTEMKGNP